jgi:hypothetical protein
MATAPPRQNVEFKTLDGLTLRGFLFPTEHRGPGMIMSPGVRNFTFDDVDMRWLLIC